MMEFLCYRVQNIADCEQDVCYNVLNVLFFWARKILGKGRKQRFLSCDSTKFKSNDTMVC